MAHEGVWKDSGTENSSDEKEESQHEVMAGRPTKKLWHSIKKPIHVTHLTDSRGKPVPHFSVSAEHPKGHPKAGKRYTLGRHTYKVKAQQHLKDLRSTRKHKKLKLRLHPSGHRIEGRDVK